MLNVGYIGSTLDGGVIAVKVYYDTNWLNDDPTRNSALAPLIDGPRGYCMDVTNASGRNAKVEVNLPNGTQTVVTVGQGDPVTSGPSKSRSQTAAQLAAAGYTTRGDVVGLSINYA